jgi:tetratricopeptide (TPR) repeat protein
MEVLAREQRIDFGGPRYRSGIHQFADNLGRVARRFREAGIPVFVGSLASNLRSQPPFSSAGNDGPGGAASVFADATQALSRGDTARARTLFVRARDLDVVRFRAPSAFDSVIRRVVAENRAVYVPVAEAFGEASPGGIVGSELLLEHVHPNRRGYALIARTFFESLRAARFLGHAARLDRLREWDAYIDASTITPFDERIAHHTLMTLTGRWPFVTAARKRDYRATYRPTSVLDSLALLVSRGGLTWQAAKLQVAADYEQRGATDSAIAEYRGLERDLPFAELPFRLEARALVAMGRKADAESLLEKAMRIEPTAAGALALGMLAVQRNDLVRGIRLLEQATILDPMNRPALYQLSLAYGLSHDLERARATAVRLFRLDPRYPGLVGWMQTIGIAR